MDEQTLKREIELCRRQMIKLSEDHSLTSHCVLQESERLDNLLNLYSEKRKATKSYA